MKNAVASLLKGYYKRNSSVAFSPDALITRRNSRMLVRMLGETNTSAITISRHRRRGADWFYLASPLRKAGLSAAMKMAASGLSVITKTRY
jgi:hypothetical protein